MKITPQQIIQLAPDASSVSAAEKLAVSSKWVQLKQNEKALWGHCQGSGKVPYRTAIDISNLAFKCSCPSRKFPCKHGLGLLMLYSQKAENLVFDPNLPAEIEEWLNKREGKAEKQKNESEPKPVDEVAQQKRVEARQKKVDLGIDELRIWIKDLARNGIMQVPQNAYQFSKNIAARMVDAQASGLAAHIRDLETINYFENGWDKLLLRQLSKLYTITEAYKNIDDFDEDWQNEIRTLVGYNQAKEEVLAQEGISDQWLVFLHQQESQNNLTTIKTWLYGIETNKYALVINFFAGNQSPTDLLSSGQIIKANLCFYQGVETYRAIIKENYGQGTKDHLKAESSSLNFILEKRAANLAKNPFQLQTPVFVENLCLQLENDVFYLHDVDNFIIPVTNKSEQLWHVFALTGGEKFAAFLLCSHSGIQVCSVLTTELIFSLS